MRKNTQPINPFPFPVYFWTVLILAIIGLSDSIYLSISHYRVYTDIGYKSFCAISRTINCDTVSQSPYSIFLTLPVPVWGIVGYVFLLLMLLIAGAKEAEKKRIWSLVLWISAFFSGYSIILAAISTYLIRSYCIMCIVSYGVNLALLFFGWIIRRRFSESGLFQDTRKDLVFLWQKRSKVIPIFSIFLVSLVITWMIFPIYWNFDPPTLDGDIPTGITASGHPWIGAENPVLEITEFADYQCFQCKKMHFFLRQLLVKNPGKIRIVHRHYPMDHAFNPIVREPFHVGSGKMALLAVYAASKNKFWQMNDLLYEIAGKQKNIVIKDLAEKAGLDKNELARSLIDQKTRYRLQYDIWAGNKLAITGTPAYLINGEVYLGQIPPEIIKIGLE